MINSVVSGLFSSIIDLVKEIHLIKNVLYETYRKIMKNSFIIDVTACFSKGHCESKKMGSIVRSLFRARYPTVRHFQVCLPLIIPHDFP